MLRTCLFAVCFAAASAVSAATLDGDATAGGTIDVPVTDVLAAPATAPELVLDAGAAQLISTASYGYYPPPPPPPSAVPIPGAIALMGSVLVGGAGLGAWRRRRQKLTVTA